MFNRRQSIRKSAIRKNNRTRMIEILEARQMFAGDGLVDAAGINSQDRLLLPPESALISSADGAITNSLPTLATDMAIVRLNDGAEFVSNDLKVLHAAFGDFPATMGPMGNGDTLPSLQSESISLGAFKLTDVIMEQTEGGYKVTGLLEAPGVERVRLSGFVSNDLSRYSLKSEPATLKAGPIELKNAVTTLDENGLAVTGEWTHSLVGTVTFAGKIGADGKMSLEATTPPRSLVGGLVKTEPGKLTLTPEGVTFVAQASVAKVGVVTFAGKIHENGSYEITGSAGLKIAGFNIEGASLTLGEESLGVSCVIPIEGIGDVQVSGAYGPNGKWLLHGKYPGSITIGPVVLNDPNFTITDEFVQANCIGTIVNLDELVEADLTTTFFYDGRIESVAVTDILEIGGFRLGRSTVIAGNNNPEREYKTTIHSVVRVEHLFDSVVTGEIDEHGNYVLKGNATVTVGGFKLSNAELTVEKGKGLTIRVEDKVLGSQVIWTGTVDNRGNYQLKANGVLKIAGLNISNAAFTLNNKEGLRFEGTTNILNATVKLSGEIKPNGTYKFEGDGNVTFPGIGKLKTHFVVENNQIRAIAYANVLGTNVKLTGSVSRTGSYSLSFEGNLKVLGFKMADATVTLDKNGLRCNGEIKVLGQKIELSGWGDSRGNFTLRANQDVSFEGLRLSSASFTLNNDGLTFRADFRNFGFDIGVRGTVESNGLVEFAGKGDFMMGSIEVDVYLHPGRDVYKMSLKGEVDLWIMKGSFQARVVKGRDGWPTPELEGSAKVKGALAKAVPGDVVDFRVSAKKVSFEYKNKVVKIQGTVTLDGRYLSCAWKVTNRQTGWSFSI